MPQPYPFDGTIAYLDEIDQRLRERGGRRMTAYENTGKT
jgi:hypothetical protein